jgi:hypothetical protein
VRGLHLLRVLRHLVVAHHGRHVVLVDVGHICLTWVVLLNEHVLLLWNHHLTVGLHCVVVYLGVLHPSKISQGLLT